MSQLNLYLENYPTLSTITDELVSTPSFLEEISQFLISLW